MDPRLTQSAGGVVVNAKGHVLVVNQNADSWSLPKGHIDPGESVLEAAKREIYEESGVKKLDFIQELPSYQRFRINKGGGEDRSELKTIHMYLFRTEQIELSPQDKDNPEARWVEPSEVVNLLTHAKDKEFFKSIIDKL